MNDTSIPAQVTRCPKCGRMYPVEEDACPHCTPPEDARSIRRRAMADPDTARLRWVYGILFGIGFLIFGGLMTFVYFKLGKQGMLESLGVPLVAAAVMYPWLFLIILVSHLSDVKGRSTLFWVILSFLIPISPLVSIPVLAILPSKTGYPVVWKHILGSALSISLVLSCLIFVVIFGVMVFTAL